MATERPSLSLTLTELDRGSWVIFELPGFTTAASGTPQDGIANTDGFGDMQQSNLEQANVEVVTEISDLIAAQRAYEMNAKVVSAADQMLQSPSNMFR